MSRQVGPNGSFTRLRDGPIITAMNESGYHRIEDDLAEDWLESWAGVGIAALEDYLSKHAAFLSFLDDAAQSA